MTLSLLGVGALLATSALAFSIVKWAGALYLIGLGLMTLRRGVGPPGIGPPVTARMAFANNIAIGTFHPKTIVFFVAFVPQFIDPRGDYGHQAALLIATFCGVVACTDATYAVLASRASSLLRQPRALRWSRRAGGGILVASGVAAAMARR